MNTTQTLGATALLALSTMIATDSMANERTTGRGGEGAPIVYVESQGLYYDSIALGTLPLRGSFQQLKPGEGPMGGLATALGPGDTGYLGGRWWIDSHENGYMDDMDTYFLCPLLGPGRSMP